jgi:hypothetical protein
MNAIIRIVPEHLMYGDGINFIPFFIESGLILLNIFTVKLFYRGGQQATGGIGRKLNCAQIVPVKVKYFQTFPNETKNWLKKLNRINWLKLRHF